MTRTCRRRANDDLAHLALGQVLVGHDLRVALALDPKALVVGEVQVQLVQLEIGEQLDLPLDPRGREVTPAVVDHEAALGIARPVAGAAGGDPVAVSQQLEQRSRPVEDARRRARLDAHALTHLEPVALGAEPAIGRAEAQLDVARCGGGARRERPL
jgi:hypothetical protein